MTTLLRRMGRCRSIFRQVSCYEQTLTNQKAIVFPSLQGKRCLFGPDKLGIDSFHRNADKKMQLVADVKDKFVGFMRESIESKRMIYTDDLKTMIFLAANDQELEVTIQMLYSYHESRNFRTNLYHFGPEVMRKLHIMDKPELAFQLFHDENLESLFDQRTSVLVLADMLLANEMPDKAIIALDNYGRRTGSISVCHNLITMYLANCLSVNSKDVYQKAQELVKAADPSKFSFRSAVYISLLAMKQDDLTEAWDYMHLNRQPGYRKSAAFFNLKALWYCHSNMHPSAVGELIKLHQFYERGVIRNCLVFKDVLSETVKGIRLVPKEKEKMEKLMKTLLQLDSVRDQTLETYYLRVPIRNTTKEVNKEVRKYPGLMDRSVLQNRK